MWGTTLSLNWMVRSRPKSISLGCSFVSLSRISLGLSDKTVITLNQSQASIS